MTDSKKAANYSPEQEAIIKAAAPLNLEKAKEIAGQIDKTFRSVISKAKSMGVEYASQPAQKKRVGGSTKTAMVEKLEGFTNQKLEGLEKSTAIALANLVAYFDAVEAEAEAEAESES